jgi:eukaryotic-like serine/threonine-protein kinase
MKGLSDLNDGTETLYAQPVDIKGTGLDALLDWAIAQCRAGEPIDLEKLVNAHPELESELRQAIPVLVALEQSGSPTAAASNVGAPREVLQGNRTLGDFRLIREVGRGGMGVVYEAEQLSLGRRVAVKVLPMAGLLDDRHVERFRHEARAAASLQHPNIVPVHSVGCERGVHYLAMQFIEGQTLAAVIHDLRHSKPDTAPSAPTVPGTPSAETHPIAAFSTEHPTRGKDRHRSIANLAMQLALALEYAHSVGIVHRDIKPANLLLDAQGKVWIADFGLAHLEGDMSLTMTGDVIGTLRYMSPEQASGRRDLVDHRSDVYSLGVTLYELLTLRPAFPQSDRIQLLSAVADQEPVNPRSVDPSIPRDLETVVLKAIAKEPQVRYVSAKAFAEDLRRFLQYEPVQAKRPGLVDRGYKWSRRHRAVTVAAAAMLVVTAVSFAASTLLIAAAFDNEAQQRLVAEGAQEQAQQRAVAAEEARAHEQAERQRAEQAEARAYRQQYQAQMQLAGVDAESGNMARLSQHLIEHLPMGTRSDLRGWEWYHLLERLHQSLSLRGHREPVGSVCWSPDSRNVATTSNDATFRIWDVVVGKEVKKYNFSLDWKRGVAWSPDGRKVAWGSDGPEKAIRVLELETDDVIVLRGHRLTNSIDWSPDSLCLLSASQDATDPSRVWDVATQQCLHVLAIDSERITAARWSPDGKRIAAVGSKGKVKVWNAMSGDMSGELQHATSLYSLHWSTHDDELLVGDYNGSCLIIDPKEMQITRRFRIHDGSVNAICMHHKGTSVASAGEDGCIILWNLADGEVVSRYRGHRDGITSLAWSPSGKQIASAGVDAEVKIWDISSAASSGILADLEHGIRDLKWASPPQQSASASTGPGRSYVPCDASSGLQIECTNSRLESISPDGMLRAYVTLPKPSPIFIEKIDSGELLASLESTGSDDPPDWSPDGSHVIVLGYRTGLELWSVREERLVFAHRDVSAQTAWAPDGKRFAWIGIGGYYDAFAHIYDMAKQSTVQKLPIGSNQIQGRRIAWSRDSRFLAAGTANGQVTVWQAEDGKKVSSTQMHASAINALDWSPDGCRLASGSRDRTVKVWDPATGAELIAFSAYAQPVNVVRWSPDGLRLAAGFADGHVQMWDASRGREMAAGLREQGSYAAMFVRRAMQRGFTMSDEQHREDYAAATRLAPEDRMIRRSSLLFNAERQAWHEALADVNKLLELDPNECELHSLRAKVYLAINQPDGYRSACATMLMQFPDAADTTEACTVLMDCSLQPIASEHHDRLVALASDLVARCDLQHSLGKLARALQGHVFYRAGSFERAVESLSILDFKGEVDQYFLAMAHHQLGNADEAKKWLDQANEQTAQFLTSWHLLRGGSIPWTLRIALEKYRDEANALITPQTSAPAG